MRRVIILLICLIPFLSHAQHDVLVLQKRGMHVRAYTIGDQMTFRTVYDQWFTGVIDDLRRDTVYINGQAFSYKEIAAIKRDKAGRGWAPALIAVGVGYLAIGAFNGAYRKDAAKDWYSKTDFIVSGALVATGAILLATKTKYYQMGRKYRLLYLQIGKR
jgi:hypothetical protein